MEGRGVEEGTEIPPRCNMAPSMHSCTQVLEAVVEQVYYTQLKFIAQVGLGARTKKDYLWRSSIGRMRLLHNLHRWGSAENFKNFDLW